MHHKTFLNQLSHERIVEAVRNAEAKTTGTIRVFISHTTAPDPLKSAHRVFHRLKLDQSPRKNAILIFVSPRSCTFAILGDKGIHERCGEAFWQSLREEVAGHFRGAAFSDGIMHAVNRAGAVLAEYFPAAPNPPANPAPKPAPG